MSVKCDDFLSFAECCLNSNDDEINYRNCVARAYYSCYHRLKPLLKKAPNGHSNLINYLCNAKDDYDEDFSAEELRTLGLLLDKEYPKRVIADYKLDKTVFKSYANKSIASANIFKLELEKMLNRS